MKWKRAAAFLPGLGVSLLPKLTCPICWPAYAGLLSALGLGFLMSERYLFGLTAFFLLISVGALAFRHKERHGLAPAALGFGAAAMVLVGKFTLNSTPATYAGLSLLIGASLWNSWPRHASSSELVQLTIKGR